MKFSKRALIAPMAGAMMLMGSLASVSAEDDAADFNIDAQADDNVCSVALSAEEFNLGALVWNQGWPSTTLSVEIGYTITATGGPGDRSCDPYATNSAFVNDDLTPIQLLDASALTVAGVGLPYTFDLDQIPVPSISGNTTVAVNTASANQSAPEDEYTSTLTVTFPVAP